MTTKRGLVWPLLLIALGTWLLLANLGLVPPVDFRRFIEVAWPLALVLIGVELALARRRPLLALTASALVVALGLGLVLGRPAVFGQNGRSGEGALTVARDGARSLSLRVTVGPGALLLRGGARELVEARSESSNLRQRAVSRSGDAVEAAVEQVEVYLGRPAHIDIRVASDVPLALRIEAGAGEFTIDLRDVATSSVRISTGASTLRLVLPAKVSGDVPVRIESGAASVLLEVPEGLEASVATTGALMSVSSTNPRLAGAGETTGYRAARDRVTVRIEAGASSVTIR